VDHLWDQGLNRRRSRVVKEGWKKGSKGGVDIEEGGASG